MGRLGIVGIDAAGAVPAGVIVMWSGSVASIPSGWVLCDGSLSTPDLTDRFVIGAGGAQNPDDTGGAATHTHAGHSNHAALAGHQHLTSVGDHDATGMWAHQSNPYGSGSVDLGSKNSYSRVSTSIGALGAALTQSISGGTPDAHSAHDSPDSRPPWYALAYIMKS